MTPHRKYAHIDLDFGDRKRLEKLSRSQTDEFRKVQRAKIILLCADGMNGIVKFSLVSKLVFSGKTP